MAACFRASEEGRIKLSRNVALKSSDKLTGSGVLKEMKDKQSSVVCHFQERDGVLPKPHMLYPLTKIELMEIRDGQVVVARTFIVNDKEQWEEPN